MFLVHVAKSPPHCVALTSHTPSRTTGWAGSRQDQGALGCLPQLTPGHGPPCGPEAPSGFCGIRLLGVAAKGVARPPGPVSRVALGHITCFMSQSIRVTLLQALCATPGAL